MATPTMKRSRSSSSDHAHAFHDGPDEFAVPEEPMTEETAVTFIEEENRAPGTASSGLEGGEAEAGGLKDERPWYRKPSPWWMLTLMPLTAMAMAGVSPSLLEIYTELACRNIQNSSIAKPQLELYLSNYSLASETNRQAFALPQVYSSVNDGFFDISYYLPLASTALHASRKADEDCRYNPEVSKAVSKLMATISSTMGILGCLTAALWSSLSDRVGRRPILIVASSAVVIMYSVKIIVWNYVDYLPGGYWFLVVGATIFGLLGGSAVTSATVYAYIVDSVQPEARSRTLSLALGLRFTLMAAGPTICALLVRLTGTPISSVVLVVAIHVAHILIVLLILPESLSGKRMEDNRRAWSESRIQRTESTSDRRENSLKETLRLISLNLFAFLRPLSIIKPVLVASPIEGKAHRDWSLTFVAISSGLASMILASYATMFQYGAKIFRWSAIELGYWYSAIIAARALTLAVILPAIIKAHSYWKARKPSLSDAQPTERTALLSSPPENSDSTNPIPSAPISQESSSRKATHHSPVFDLTIAQASLVLEVACYALVPALAHIQFAEWTYIFLTVLASCGAGFGPAIQALAVDVHTRRSNASETGRLFGVLGVVQAISSQVLGPMVFGLTYVKLVDIDYPAGIFFVSVAATGSACLALFFIELPSAKERSRPEGS